MVRPICLLLLFVMLGCSGDGQSSPTGDAGVAVEASTEAGPEASPDGPADSSTDVLSDTPLEDPEELIELAGGDACAEYAYAGCMRVNACMASRSMRRCTPALAVECRAEAAVPGSGMTDDALRACAEALEADWCGRPFACQFAAKGSREQGATCHYNAQCETGFCLRSSLLSIKCETDANGEVTCAPPCGTCAERFSAGESCSGDPRGCEDGLVCSYDLTCIQPKPEGAACQADQECIRPLECSLLEDHCQPREKDYCIDEEDCIPQMYCAPGGCAVASSAGLGEECNAPGGYPLVECSEGYCVGSITKTCIPAVPVGGPCSGSTAPCEPVAHCFEDACHPIDYAVCL